MRVLMVHSFLHPRGGDTTYTRDLSALLAGAGHEVIPLAMRHPDNEPSPWEARFPSWVDPRGAETPVDRVRALARSAWSLEAAAAARSMARDLRPDIAHVQHLHRHLTPSVLRALRDAGVPVVWTVHDYELICPAGHLYTGGHRPEGGAPCERCRGHRYAEAVRHRCKWGRLLPSAAVAAEKALHRRLGVWGLVDRFLCPSQWLADALVRFGIESDRVEVVPNPVDAAAHPAGDGPGRGWLFAGRLAEEKGLRDLVAAARRLHRSGHLAAHPLTIVGGGPLLDELHHRTRDLPGVHLTGPLPRSEVQARLRASRVVVVPSRWPENLPYAVSEAQAAGRAVVASDIGGIPELVDSGRDGVLVPPADPPALARAAAALLDDPEHCEVLGAAARRRVVARLDPAAHLARIEGIYRARRSAGPLRTAPLRAGPLPG